MTATHITAPDGSLWQLVPVEPAAEMQTAAAACWDYWQNGHVVNAMWSDMLAAAPEFDGVAVAWTDARGAERLREGKQELVGPRNASSDVPLFAHPPAAAEAIVSAARAVIEARKDAHFPERCTLTDAIDELEAAMRGGESGE